MPKAARAKIKAAAGKRVTTSCKITTDVKTLHESLGIDIEAGGTYAIRSNRL